MEVFTCLQKSGDVWITSLVLFHIHLVFDHEYIRTYWTLLYSFGVGIFRVYVLYTQSPCANTVDLVDSWHSWSNLVCQSWLPSLREEEEIYDEGFIWYRGKNTTITAKINIWKTMPGMTYHNLLGHKQKPVSTPATVSCSSLSARGSRPDLEKALSSLSQSKIRHSR